MVGTIKASNADIDGMVTAKALNTQSATIADIDLIEVNTTILQKMEVLILYIAQIEKRLAEIEDKKGDEK